MRRRLHIDKIQNNGFSYAGQDQIIEPAHDNTCKMACASHDDSSMPG